MQPTNGLPLKKPEAILNVHDACFLLASHNAAFRRACADLAADDLIANNTSSIGEAARAAVGDAVACPASGGEELRKSVEMMEMLARQNAEGLEHLRTLTTTLNSIARSMRERLAEDAHEREAFGQRMLRAAEDMEAHRKIKRAAQFDRFMEHFEEATSSMMQEFKKARGPCASVSTQVEAAPEGGEDPAMGGAPGGGAPGGAPGGAARGSSAVDVTKLVSPGADIDDSYQALVAKELHGGDIAERIENLLVDVHGKDWKKGQEKPSPEKPICLHSSTSFMIFRQYAHSSYRNYIVYFPSGPVHGYVFQDFSQACAFAVLHTALPKQYTTPGCRKWADFTDMAWRLRVHHMSEQ